MTSARHLSNVDLCITSAHKPHLPLFPKVIIVILRVPSKWLPHGFTSYHPTYSNLSLESLVLKSTSMA